MKKKLFSFGAIIIVFLILFTAGGTQNLYNKHITLPMDQITSGVVSDTRVGGTLRHELSSTELNGFINFFNSCNITERECKKISGKHTSISDSTDISLQMNNGSAIYFMAFWDGEIYVTDEYNSKYYSLYDKRLLNYILGMGKCLN